MTSSEHIETISLWVGILMGVILAIKGDSTTAILCIICGYIISILNKSDRIIEILKKK